MPGVGEGGILYGALQAGVLLAMIGACIQLVLQMRRSAAVQAAAVKEQATEALKRKERKRWFRAGKEGLQSGTNTPFSTPKKAANACAGEIPVGSPTGPDLWPWNDNGTPIDRERGWK